MGGQNFYVLPSLNYGYDELQPYISETQLQIHHLKHHQAYVNGANAILERLERSRKENMDLDMKSLLKELSFNVGGHILHSLFWENLAPSWKGGGEPGGLVGDIILKEFGSFERFKKEFSQAAVTVEGSGWAALTLCNQTGRPLIMQIEKHNQNVYPAFKVLMVIDVFEHAYYIDYKNDRSKFVAAVWNIINWEKVEERLRKSAGP